MLTIHVWPKWLKEFLLTHPLYKSPCPRLSLPILFRFPFHLAIRTAVFKPLIKGLNQQNQSV